MSLSSLTFCDLTIDYDDGVLEPRPWTQLQSRWAVELLAGAPAGPVLELCSGAGHIGLGAIAGGDRSLVAVDLSVRATELTRHNAERAGLGDQVETRTTTVAEALRPGEQFVLAIADPPWVRSRDVARYPEDPPTAIDGGGDGLDVARACVDTVSGHLPSGASLLLQLGTTDQARALGDEVRVHGWFDHSTRRGEGGVVLRLLHP